MSSREATGAPLDLNRAARLVAERLRYDLPEGGSFSRYEEMIVAVLRSALRAPSPGRERLCERCHITPTTETIPFCEVCKAWSQEAWYPPVERPSDGEALEKVITDTLMHALGPSIETIYLGWACEHAHISMAKHQGGVRRWAEERAKDIRTALSRTPTSGDAEP